MLRVRWFKSGAKVKDNYITGYVESVTWEGSAEQVSRTATITMANNPYDKKMQCVLGLGDIIYLYEDKKEYFAALLHPEKEAVRSEPYHIRQKILCTI